MKKLLTTETMVESPLIILKIGDYTFGSYNSKGTLYNTAIGSRVTYPNFMQSIKARKVSGEFNTYTITMVYAIREGDDPNFLERVFSTVSQTRTLTLTYGDCASPSFIYKEEEALITNISSSLDFSGSKISYTIKCTSKSLGLHSNRYSFPRRVAKPSVVIRELLQDRQKGLLEIFYGMKNTALVNSKALIAADDKEVIIDAQTNVTVIDYLNYLVSCMESVSNPYNSVIMDSVYTLAIFDETRNDFQGPYFRIAKVPTRTRTKDSYDTFEVDVGAQNIGQTNYVTSFAVNSNNVWSILFDYGGQIAQSEYVSKIDDNGVLKTEYSPNITTSGRNGVTTQESKSWWSSATELPISATLTIKGLIRPTILMSYVRINVWFYGRKHNSSGLYFIKNQEDDIDSRGYRTTLSLTRIKDGGEE